MNLAPYLPNFEILVLPKLPILENNGLLSQLIVKPITSNERKKNSFLDFNSKIYLQSGFAPFIPKVRNAAGKFFLSACLPRIFRTNEKRLDKAVGNSVQPITVVVTCMNVRHNFRI